MSDKSNEPESKRSRKFVSAVTLQKMRAINNIMKKEITNATAHTQK